MGLDEGAYGECIDGSEGGAGAAAAAAEATDRLRWHFEMAHAMPRIIKASNRITRNIIPIVITLSLGAETPEPKILGKM